MPILRTQYFIFTLVVLVPLISSAISVSRAQIVDKVSQSTRSPSPILVNDVVYTTNGHSIPDPPSFFPSPTPTTQSASIINEILGQISIDVSGRDDTALPSPSKSPISSALDSSTGEPQSSIVSTLLLSPTTTALPSESSTATSRENTVPLSAVVGGAVGGSVVLVAFIVFIFVTRRQRSPRIEPYTLRPDVERPEPRGPHGRQMSQHISSGSGVPIIRPPVHKQSHPAVAPPNPLLPPGAKQRSLYDHKIAISSTSLHSTHTTVSEAPLRRTCSQNYDTASVISRASSDYRRHRPLPRPPTDKPPPVPSLPHDLRLPRPRPEVGNVATAPQPASAVPSQSLTSSAPLCTSLSPISPIDVDIGDYANTVTSPLALSPARRDSQLLEASGSPVPARSPRRLPAPPVSVSIPPPLQTLGPPTQNIPTGSSTAATPTAESEASTNLHFDADGRPDSPSVAKMYAELLELQRQVARLREDLPGRTFGEAPPEYAESVVGSVVGSVRA